MNKQETRQYEMLVRVSEFGRSHPDLFPDASPAANALTAIVGAVTDLNLYAASKVSSHGAARDGADTRAVAREALREYVDAVSRTARLMAEENPELVEKFRLPDARTDRALLVSARVFVQDSEAFEVAFVANGLPPTFRAELDVAAERFEHCLRGRDTGRTRHTAAQAGITAALETGLAALRKLDIIVTNRLRNDPVTMTVWERERRLRHARGAARPEAPSDPEPKDSPQSLVAAALAADQEDPA